MRVPVYENPGLSRLWANPDPQIGAGLHYCGELNLEEADFHRADGHIDMPHLYVEVLGSAKHPSPKIKDLLQECYDNLSQQTTVDVPSITGFVLDDLQNRERVELDVFCLSGENIVGITCHQVPILKLFYTANSSHDNLEVDDTGAYPRLLRNTQDTGYLGPNTVSANVRYVGTITARRKCFTAMVWGT